MNVPARILIVDSQAIFRQGLRCLLSSTDGFIVVGEAADGRTAVHALEETRPDIVITDLALDLQTGFDVAGSALCMDPNVAPVVLAESAPDEYVFISMQRGIAGYFLKDDPFETLYEGLKTIARGETAYAPSISKRIPLICRNSFTQNGHKLSERELDVIRLYGSGKTTGQVADCLGISLKTVDSHRAHIALKLNIRSHEYPRYAAEHGLIEFKRCI